MSLTRRRLFEQLVAPQVRTNLNENPIGPGPHVLEAIIGKFPEAARYPFNARQHEGQLPAAIAAKFPGAKPENVVMGAGSGPELPQSMWEIESKRNHDARAFTMKWFADRGYQPTDSQTNFIFVDIKRPAADFRTACARDNVYVGRNFPPYEKSHTRISIGTMAEMQRAVQTFERALAKPAAAA